MRLLLITLSFLYNSVYADTIDHYMNIANNIPQMEIKADAQAQAWARSAHHVLTITCESIAETMTQANETAKGVGKPIFCLPQGVQLSAMGLNDLIQQTYKEMPNQSNDKDKMTVSQIAWLAVIKHYPCQSNNAGKDMAFLKATQ